MSIITPEEIVPRDLITSEGTGHRAEQIAQVAAAMYPEEFQRAQKRPRNEELTAALTDSDYEFVQQLLGTSEFPCLAVRGETPIDRKPAIVTYSVIGGNGDATKGFLPLASLRARSDEGHVSQLQLLQLSDVAEQVNAERAKAAADNPIVQAQLERINELEAQLAEAKATPTVAKPSEDYDGLTVPDIVSRLAKASAAAAEKVLAYEQSTQKRKGVVKAAQERIAATQSDAEAKLAEAEAKLAEQVQANAKLQAELAAKEDGQGTPDAAAGDDVSGEGAGTDS